MVCNLPFILHSVYCIHFIWHWIRRSEKRKTREWEWEQKMYRTNGKRNILLNCNDMYSILIVWICQKWILFNTGDNNGKLYLLYSSVSIWSGERTFNVNMWWIQDFVRLFFFSCIDTYQWLVIKHVTSNAFHLGIVNINQINVQYQMVSWGFWIF